MKLKTYISRITVVAAVFAMVACESDPNSPGVEYMPDMYRSPAVEAYVDYGLDADKIRKSDDEYEMQSRQPVKGTIPRGHMMYPYPDSPEGYEMAGTALTNPIACTDAVMEQGKDLYMKFCSHCHGDKGDGQGTIVARGKFPPPPAYNSAGLKDLPVGKMFHTLQYGKGLMGSHASQLSIAERWTIIHYVQKLQGKEKCEPMAATEGEAAPEEGEAAPAPAAEGDAPADENESHS